MQNSNPKCFKTTNFGQIPSQIYNNIYRWEQYVINVMNSVVFPRRSKLFNLQSIDTALKFL